MKGKNGCGGLQPSEFVAPTIQVGIDSRRSIGQREGSRVLGCCCGPPALQGRRSTENNSPVFNVPAETKQLSRDSSMWLAVPTCAHLSVGWAQKLAQSRRCPGRSPVRSRKPAHAKLIQRPLQGLQISPTTVGKISRTRSQRRAMGPRAPTLRKLLFGNLLIYFVKFRFICACITAHFVQMPSFQIPLSDLLSTLKYG